MTEAHSTLESTLFLLPPDAAELRQRLHGRQDSDDTVPRRLQAAREEIARCDGYDYILVNRDLDGTLEALDIILRAERLRRERPTRPLDGWGAEETTGIPSSTFPSA